MRNKSKVCKYRKKLNIYAGNWRRSSKQTQEWGSKNARKGCSSLSIHLDFLYIFMKCCKAEEFAEEFCYENGQRNGLLLLEVFCQVVIGKTSLVKIDPWEEDQPFQTTRLPAPRPCGIARVAPLYWVKLWSSGNRLLVQHWRLSEAAVAWSSTACGTVPSRGISP